MLMTIPMMCYFISMMLALSSMLIMMTNMTIIMSWEIYTLFSSSMSLDIIMEWMSMMYSSIIMFISGNVMKFSKNYMHCDHNYNRFTYIVMLFILSMNLLVFIPNMMCLLIGWDGLGITSFILIIYYNNSRSLGAGVLTMLINRLGDVFLLMAIVCTLKTSNWLPISTSLPNMSLAQLMGITMAAMTKSAQLPYSSWLPAAMAAPTPVSALVHSSTLVTAGIFLLYRFKLLISSSITVQLILSITGLTTMLMASLSAIMENDLKKIIALSTLSQLGMMILCLGLSMFKLSFLHMMCHAIFKALLFITAGCLISLNNHNQDLRLYNQYYNMSPIASSSMTVASLTMIGMPFMTGFYSKHAIMEWSLSTNMNTMISLMMMASIFMTSYYSMRLILFLTTIPSMKSPMHTHLSSKDTNYPMLSMSIMSILMATNIQWLIPLIPMYQPLTHKTQTMTINCLILLSMIMTLLMMNKPNKMPKPYKHQMMMFSTSMSFFTPLLTELIPPMWLNMSLKLYKYLDQSWLEKMLTLGPSMNLFNSSSYTNLMPISIPQKNLLSTLIMSLPLMIMLFYNKML